MRSSAFARPTSRLRTASRRATIRSPAALSKLYATATDPARRKSWFPPGAFEETSKTDNKYWRGKWKTGRKLEFGFYAKGEGKASITLEIRQIPSEADLEKERAAWKKAVEKLGALVT